jgi:hypothetical protein
MDNFEYISVLISILLGLATTHLVVGAVSIVQNRDSTQIYWVHLLWVVNTLVWITQFWWFMFGWDKLDSWPISIFYLLFGYALALSASAGLLFPVRETVTDYRRFYYEHFRWFFGIQLLAACIDVVETTVKASVGLRPIPPEYWPLQIPVILVILAALLAKNPKVHLFLAVAMLSLNMLFGWSSVFAPVL